MYVAAANCIWLIHVALVFFMVYGALFSHGKTLWLTECGYLLLFIHWHFNSNACALTTLEESLRGVETSATFMHSIVEPIYSISSTSMGAAVWGVSLLLFTIGMIRLFHQQITYPNL